MLTELGGDNATKIKIGKWWKTAQMMHITTYVVLH